MSVLYPSLFSVNAAIRQLHNDVILVQLPECFSCRFLVQMKAIFFLNLISGIDKFK